MIRVEYGVIAKDAKEGFIPELLNCAPISNADDLAKDDLVFKNYANPCEKYGALLDGGSLPIPDNTDAENMGVWSLYTCDESGEFVNYFPTIILSADVAFSAEGLGLTFDTVNNVYPTEFDITWYMGESVVLKMQYESSSPSFSAMEDVAEFDKIEIVFRKMNTPYSRLKLHAIQYGSILIIEEKLIKSLRVHQAASTLSTTIPISSLDLVFLNSNGANYNFLARQSLKVIDNDVLIGQYFIENAKQTNKQQWTIKAQDYIATLESTEFEGGIYYDELAFNVLTAIFNTSGVPFTVADGLKGKTITGYIPYSTCRRALQQVLFAIGAYANTAYSESVDIVESDLTITESIGLDRVMMGQTISVDADITEIELVGHTYTRGDAEVTLHQASEAEENLKIIFNEPVYDLTIEGGEIIESGTNYAIITCQEGDVLRGKKYEHSTFSKTKYNTESKNKKGNNKKSIKNATLISASNIDSILSLCYNHIKRSTEVRSRVIEGSEPLIVGKAYEIETELLGNIVGVITEQSFSLYGGKKIVKETVIK
jgi:hypothetical protein